ncbi:MAG TPA: hypothetical protein VHX12_09410 [Acidisoma sp.]|nr:hypothetical protein [Acidisoma sp.]
MTDTARPRPDAPAKVEPIPRDALIFDSCGHADPPGGLDWDAHNVSAWPCRVIWCGPEPYSFKTLLGAIAVIIPGDVVSFSDQQLATLVQRMDLGNAVAISARSEEIINAACVTIHRLCGGAGNG